MENKTSTFWRMLPKTWGIIFAAQFLWAGFLFLLGLFLPMTLSFSELLTETYLQISWALGPVLAAPLLAIAVAGARVRSHGLTVLRLLLSWAAYFLPVTALALIQGESVFPLIFYTFAVYGNAWAVPIATAILLGKVFYAPMPQTPANSVALGDSWRAPQRTCR
ncbi:hypothetical protein V5R04_10795 [Jonesiaceae bacterium BS-20]|uniref:Uncharacterized protein n=1 Tax=Jonesiaceae bacterium BS-20 TaxID=3120821 RepID=A0AAU7DUQ2_9MICO